MAFGRFINSSFFDCMTIMNVKKLIVPVVGLLIITALVRPKLLLPLLIIIPGVPPF
jgi:hypothetical protein